eukprot:TRINITY_DN1253_c0_g1_i1.p1 TRINITY_DN1253_c0_g1~~TRINITY_DN1253_c0_g1_i1.p1  ORF type:complete len:292 (-),score=97.33 TRINITY_DN1253_c0_g1_i1:46-921(-)
MDNLNFDVLSSVLGEVGEGEYAEGEGEGEYAEGGYTGGEYDQSNTSMDTSTTDFKAIAKYEYIAERENDLTIYIGDEITVQQSEGEWWYGYIIKDGNTYTGYFPATYVEKSEGELSKPSDFPSESDLSMSQQVGLKNQTGWRLERDNLKDSIHQQIESISQLQKLHDEKKKQKQLHETSYLNTRYIHDTQALFFDLLFMQLERNVEVRSFSMLAEIDQKFSLQMKNLQELINKELKDKTIDPPKTELFKMITLISNKISENLSSIGTLTNSSDQFLNVLNKFKTAFINEVK